MGHKCKLDTGYLVDHTEWLCHNKHTVVVCDIETCVASTSLKIVTLLSPSHCHEIMDITDEWVVEKNTQPLSQTLFGLKEAAYSFRCANHLTIPAGNQIAGGWILNATVINDLEPLHWQHIGEQCSILKQLYIQGGVFVGKAGNEPTLLQSIAIL